MDTNRLKRFATEARNILNQGVAQRFITLGFRPDGTTIEEPVERGGGATFMGDVVSMDFYHKWMSLKHAVDTKRITEVVEEAAYTWFNRLMAIRIMVKNGLITPVLEYESSDVRVPLIVAEARQGRYPDMDEQTREKLMDLLDDDSKTSDQFRMLIVAYCHSCPVINKCFGNISDYTELLLPANILAEGGFVDLLNNTQFISEEDFLSPELIGWLYQFYISEKKDDVFASFKKGKKAEAKDIPAATQIFTPNWIVKYMVENTVGRIYLDNNPYSDIREGMRYLVEPSEKPTADSIFQLDDIHDLTCADLACGSGHILNEAFDLLYQIYIEEGYNRRKAVEDIFRYNLTGIDLDTRAKQLAQFALLMKACQKDSSFADGHCMPRVYDMPKVNRYTYRDTAGHFDCAYHLCCPSSEELDAAFTLMENADNLGSIMKFDISPETREYLVEAVDCFHREPKFEEAFNSLIDGYIIILSLTQKYAALCMNPPYMGAGNMNATLSQYVKDNYAMGKADLFSVFMLLSEDHLADGGLYGMINMQSWMFLSSFESLRCHVLKDSVIENMLHLGPRTFDELSGEVVQNTAFVIRNTKPSDITRGTYYRLVDGKDCGDKERMFLADDGNKIYYPNIPQDNFKKIPGSPIGYWVSEKVKDIFESSKPLSNTVKSCVGLQTGDNDKFIRQWHEIVFSSIGFLCNDENECIESQKEWFPYNKGGEGKWYGGNRLVVLWYQNGQQVKNHPGCNLRNVSYYFKAGITFPRIGSSNLQARIAIQGSLFDINGPTCYSDNDDYLLGLMNSNVMVSFLRILCPSLTFQVGDVFKVPYIKKPNSTISTLVQDNISISRLDWDSHETSWDFRRNPIYEEQLQVFVDEIADTMPDATVDDISDYHAPDLLQPLEVLVNNYKSKWEDMFHWLHRNEEELNRQFIDIYGLQDELTPDVPLSEVTILQQGEISIQ